MKILKKNRLLHRGQAGRDTLLGRGRRLAQSMCEHKLLTLGLTIHLLFYVSALWTGWLNIFFSGESLHVATPYIDFLQIPRGAYNWWHYGPLTGVAQHGVVYGPVPYWVNPNVYHPLFTLELGSFLMLLTPGTAYAVWIWVKLGIDLLTIDAFWRAVRTTPHGEFATFILLASFSEYAELADGQYHFVLNISLLCFLMLLEKKSAWWSAISYAGSILVKPIGLLFVPALLFKRQWKVVLIGLVLVAVATWPFLLAGYGAYYIDNLKATIGHWSGQGPDQIMTLNAFLHFSSHWPEQAYTILQYATLGVILLLSSLPRTSKSRAIFYAVVYFLLFYTLVYEYDWSTLSYVLPVCIVVDGAFQTTWARICAALTCLPGCFLVLRLLHVDVSYSVYLGWHPGLFAWQIMVLSKVAPVLMLCGWVLVSDVSAGVKRLRKSMHRNRLDNAISGGVSMSAKGIRILPGQERRP
jgi:hypothetical protein